MVANLDALMNDPEERNAFNTISNSLQRCHPNLVRADQREQADAQNFATWFGTTAGTKVLRVQAFVDFVLEQGPKHARTLSPELRTAFERVLHAGTGRPLLNLLEPLPNIITGKTNNAFAEMVLCGSGLVFLRLPFMIISL